MPPYWEIFSSKYQEPSSMPWLFPNLREILIGTRVQWRYQRFSNRVGKQKETLKLPEIEFMRTRLKSVYSFGIHKLHSIFFFYAFETLSVNWDVSVRKWLAVERIFVPQTWIWHFINDNSSSKRSGKSGFIKKEFLFFFKVF